MDKDIPEKLEVQGSVWGKCYLLFCNKLGGCLVIVSWETTLVGLLESDNSNKKLKITIANQVNIFSVIKYIMWYYVKYPF